MSLPQASKGPTTARKSTLAGIWVDFAKAMIDADGDWVEIELDDREARSAYTSVHRYIGTQYADVHYLSGILYGRMKES